MPSRSQILAVATQAKSLSDILAKHMSARFQLAAEPKNDELIATLIGLRARNGLRGLIAMADEGIDDQVGILSRALTEGVIDLQYLRTATLRRVGKERQLLRTIDKEELFLSAGIISEARIRGEVLTVPLEEVERARALRSQLRISGKCIYWHCGTGTGAVLDELKAALTDPIEISTLENVYHMFQLYSFNTHTSPHSVAYFEEAPGGGWPWSVKESYQADDAVAGCVLLGIHTLRLWGLSVEHDVTQGAMQLIKQLTAD